jgi:hypothetical protein
MYACNYIEDRNEQRNQVGRQDLRAADTPGFHAIYTFFRSAADGDRLTESIRSFCRPAEQPIISLSILQAAHSLCLRKLPWTYLCTQVTTMCCEYADDVRPTCSAVTTFPPSSCLGISQHSRFHDAILRLSNVPSSTYAPGLTAVSFIRRQITARETTALICDDRA